MVKRQKQQSSFFSLRSAQRTGATAVEFALIAQVMFLLVFGAIEFSRLHMMRNLAQDAAYFAARDSMVPGATEAEAIAAAEGVLSYMNTQGAQVIVNDGQGLNQQSNEVSVSVSIPIADNALFVSKFVGDKTIVSTATMRTERYDGYYDPNN